MTKLKFLICKHCGNVIVFTNDSGVTPVCCGEKMQILEANTTDAAFEKHVPVVSKEGNAYKVQVGETLHPMTSEHYIEWIVLETDKGFEIKYLKPNDEPIATFVTNDKVINTYAYCNLHSLWKKENKE